MHQRSVHDDHHRAMVAVLGLFITTQPCHYELARSGALGGGDSIVKRSPLAATAKCLNDVIRHAVDLGVQHSANRPNEAAAITLMRIEAMVARIANTAWYFYLFAM